MPTEEKPLLFLLEDDPTLRDEFRSLAMEAGWEIVDCYSIATGLRIAKEKSSDVRLAFIDMMVPETDHDYELLRIELDKRDAFAEECSASQQSSEFSEEQLRAAREKLLLMEPLIQELVNLDGGSEFLRGASRDIANWRIVVFSSRTPTTDGRAPAGVLQDNWIGWRQKPVDPEVILQILQKERIENRGGAQ